MRVTFCPQRAAAPLSARARGAAAAAPASRLHAPPATPQRAGSGSCSAQLGSRAGRSRQRVSRASGDGASHASPSQSPPGGEGGSRFGASPQPQPQSAPGGESASRRGPSPSPASASGSASVGASAVEAEAESSTDVGRREAFERGPRVRRPPTSGALRNAHGMGRAKPGQNPPPLDMRTVYHLYDKGWWPNLGDIEAAISKPGRYETFCYETAQPAIDFLDNMLRDQPPRKNGLAAAASVLARQPKLQTRRADKMAQTVDFLRSEGLDAAKLVTTHPTILSRSLESMKKKLNFLRLCIGATNEQLNTVWGGLLTMPQRRLRERFFYARWARSDFLERYSATTMVGISDAAFLTRVHGKGRGSAPEEVVVAYRRVVESPEFSEFCAAEEDMLQRAAARKAKKLAKEQSSD